MTENGYIKLHRSILKWEWWNDDATLKVFLYLLMNANWEDSRYRGFDVPRGSLVTGRKKIAEECHLSEKNVRTAINHLKSTNEVAIKTTNKFSIVTIVNWEKYQCEDSESANKTANKVANKWPTSGHIKEYKEVKNKELYISNEQNCRNPEFIKLLEREVKG